MRTGDDGPWLGLDVGGANIKAAHESGVCLSVPFALWRDPGRLPDVLLDAARQVPPFRRVALTMTAELCDCFATKSEGVRHVLDATTQAVGPRPLTVWCIDGRFRDPGDVRDNPRLAAAANWLALAEVAASADAHEAGAPDRHRVDDDRRHPPRR